MKACVECGERFPLENLISIKGVLVCEICKPIIEQSVKPFEHAEILHLKTASIVLRFLAFLIDMMIVCILFAIFAIMAYILLMLLSIFLWASKLTYIEDYYGWLFSSDLPLNIFLQIVILFYFVYFVGKKGATLGQLVFKIKIIRLNGSPVGYYLAAGRYFASLFSAFIFFIGFLIILFDKKNAQALHDRICKTWVVQNDFRKNHN